MAGESLNRPDESKLSSVRFLLSPLVVLRTPCADLRSACHGGAAGGQGHFQFSSNRLSRHTQVLCYFPCTPRATALRQARVSGGNLQNCAPSAACGGAMTQERIASFVPPRPPSSFSCKHSLADIDNPRNFGYAIYVTKVLNYVIITNAYRKE